MKKRIIIALLTVMILVTSGVLIWDYNNPVAEIDIMQSGDYQTPLFVTLTQNRFIKNKTIESEAHKFNEAVETDYLAFLDNYEKPYRNDILHHRNTVKKPQLFCQAHRAGWWCVQKRHLQHGDFPYCRSRCSHPAHREVGQGGQTLPAHIDRKRVSNDALK